MKNVKKIFTLFLSIVTIISLAACAGNNSTISGKRAGSSQSEKEANASSSKSLEQTGSKGEESTNSKKKFLVAYFSRAAYVSDGTDAISGATEYVGNTATVAYEVHKIVGGDIFEIAPVKSYPENHRECSTIAEQELRNNARSKLSRHVENMDSYDVIFIGYPIWWHTEPMAVRTFLEEYNFSGKTIVPFCTSLGDGIDGSIKDITALCPKSNVLDGIALRNVKADSIPDDVSVWLKKIGMVE